MLALRRREADDRLDRRPLLPAMRHDEREQDMKSPLEEAAHAYLAELIRVASGEEVAAIRNGNGASIVLTENGRAYRITADVAIEEISR